MVSSLVFAARYSPWTYSDMSCVLGTFVAAPASGTVDVPKLNPPVQQEGILGNLTGRHLGLWEVVDGIRLQITDAIDTSVAWTCFLVAVAELHLEIALDHHARHLGVVVADKVVVDVCVELVARFHHLALGTALAIVHDGSASDGTASIHVCHGGGHLRVLHGARR